MIKVLLFDIGRVLCDDDFPRLYKSFAEKIGADPEVVSSYNVDNLHDLIIGKIAPEDYWHFMRDAGQVKDEKEVKKLLVSEGLRLATVNHELLGIIDDLRKKYKMGIVSNLTVARELIDEAQGLYPHFDFLILSNHEGVKKPGPEIFQLALERAGVAPDEAVFIDDHEDNIQAASAVGIHGIVFTDNKTLIKDLAALGVTS